MDTALAVVGLSHRARHFPRTLSGGEQQRVGIARGIGEASPVLLTAGYSPYLNGNPLHGPMASLPLVALNLVRSGRNRSSRACGRRA